tara:strand:+ start:54 stop:440 length:387 start_codon:yes stop_codon:yes gene_type:complete
MKVWTNGCFDILHRGHIELFRYAKSLGNELVVGLDTDEKVKLDKSEDRPINNLQDRMFMLQSIKYIDKVIPFDSTDDLSDTIKWYQPDIMVIGSDWKGKSVIGEIFTKKLIFFDRVGDYSTTNILETK